MALAAPITLEPDHNDVLAARDSGFLQLHCATCQEVLDRVLLAYRLAEDPRVRLPAIVNLDGFYLSFTREPVSAARGRGGAGFLRRVRPWERPLPRQPPVSQAVAVLGGGPYSYFRYEMHLAAQNALGVYDEVAGDFERALRPQLPAGRVLRCEDAEIVFLMMGSFASKAKAAVDALRSEGEAVGLVRPAAAATAGPAGGAARGAARSAQGVAVVDQNLSIGNGWDAAHGARSRALRAARGPAGAGELRGRPRRPRHLPAEFFEIAADTRRSPWLRASTPEPRLLYTEAELREVRKLQGIAVAERRSREWTSAAWRRRA